MARGAACCGSLAHHLGRTDEALAAVRNNIDAWMRELDGAGLDAIVINASGCGTTVKDYGYMLRRDPDYADRAARISSLARDVTEVLDELGPMPPAVETGLAVAYHSACSMQHGQAVNAAPRKLLAAAGFTVREVPEGHLCCGSAAQIAQARKHRQDRRGRGRHRQHRLHRPA
jgi:glycolate oxidase iron-sulfur subunit